MNSCNTKRFPKIRLHKDQQHSDLSGFYNLSVKKRLGVLKKFAHLSRNEINALKKCGSLGLKTADRMVENVVGTTEFPVGIATNFIINGKNLLIPMAIEEPSVIAAASNAAKLARQTGGFKTESDEPIMIGQIQLVGLNNKQCEKARVKILMNKKHIIRICNNKDSVMVKLGGGIKDVEVRKLDTSRGKMLVVHLIVDVRDAMGANSINTMAESVSPYLEELTGGKARLRIISNLAIYRMSRATAVWSRKVLGDDLIEGILDAHALAETDPFRCATHNKGVMNGIDSVLIATGNDFRAVAAGAYSYAAYKPGHNSLTTFYKDKNGDLVGTIEIPLAVGIVGGATKTNPVSQVSLKILDVKTAQELAQIAACVGLANNFAAMRAMIKEGIQRGHMKLHAENIATTAGAKPNEVKIISKRLIESNCISVGNAHEIIKEMRKTKREKKIKTIKKRFLYK
jgi:hydroxymethylglutaryl-CoA reductase